MLFRTYMFLFILSILPLGSSSLFCLWNHFHTLTAQCLARCPGALRVLFATTADRPSCSSIGSPSSVGTVYGWEHLTCPELGECPHWALLWVLLMGGVSPTAFFLLISPPGETSGSLTQSDQFRDFPGGAVAKNPPANAGDTGSSPGPGRSHMPRSN